MQPQIVTGLTRISAEILTLGVYDGTFVLYYSVQDFFTSVRLQWEERLQEDGFCFFDTTLKGLSLPCEVSDFKASQVKHLQAMEEMLLNDWRRGIKDNLMDALQDQFNMFISDMDEYVKRHSFAWHMDDVAQFG